MILHLPHASKLIPFMDGYVLPMERLQAEIHLLTDHYTDDLFQREDAFVVKSPCSRIFCDMERFEDDALEVMSRYGMGVLYTRTDDGTLMRQVSPDLRHRILEEYYRPHHQRLTMAVDAELDAYGSAIVFDCHSYPENPLIRDLDQNRNRPDFNIGTDEFHTPAEWVARSVDFFKSYGYSIGVDWPYKGCIVPMKHYRSNPQVKAIMLEVNRKLYMDEKDGARLSSFNSIRAVVQSFIEEMCR